MYFQIQYQHHTHTRPIKQFSIELPRSTRKSSHCNNRGFEWQVGNIHSPPTHTHLMYIWGQSVWCHCFARCHSISISTDSFYIWTSFWKLIAHCTRQEQKQTDVLFPPPTNDTESISKTNSRHRIRKQSKRTATAVAPTVNYSPQRLLSDQNIKSISAGRRNV